MAGPGQTSGVRNTARTVHSRCIADLGGATSRAVGVEGTSLWQGSPVRERIAELARGDQGRHRFLEKHQTMLFDGRDQFLFANFLAARLAGEQRDRAGGALASELRHKRVGSAVRQCDVEPISDCRRAKAGNRWLRLSSPRRLDIKAVARKVNVHRPGPRIVAFDHHFGR